MSISRIDRMVTSCHGPCTQARASATRGLHACVRQVHKQMRLKKDGNMTQTKRRTRGLIALIASAAIALLIHYGLTIPYPNLKAAYLISVGVALWGFIDIVRSLTNV